MYIPIKKVTAVGDLLSDGSAVPAFSINAAGTYQLLSAGGVTFDVFLGANGVSRVIDIPVKKLISGPVTKNITLLGQ